MVFERMTPPFFFTDLTGLYNALRFERPTFLRERLCFRSSIPTPFPRPPLIYPEQFLNVFPLNKATSGLYSQSSACFIPKHGINITVLVTRYSNIS